MKKPNCCKKIANRTFKEEGKRLFISLFVVWIFVAMATEEANPIKWPIMIKPLYFIITCSVFIYLSSIRSQPNRLNRKKKE